MRINKRAIHTVPAPDPVDKMPIERTQESDMAKLKEVAAMELEPDEEVEDED